MRSKVSSTFGFSSASIADKETLFSRSSSSSEKSSADGVAPSPSPSSPSGLRWGGGAEAAARHYYGVSASQLSAEQAATLAAMLPRPRFYERNRAGVVISRLTNDVEALDACLRSGLPRGQVSELVGPQSSGRLTLLWRFLASATRRGEIVALGAGIQDSSSNFDLAKLRYHKVVIMTDADVDGAHIRTLLLTFFYRYMPAIIEAGYLYIAQPPLYRVSTGKETKYAMNEAERDEAIASFKTKNVGVQRFKGLGEMNAEQLWETAMNPENRRFLQARIEDAAAANEIFEMLMGERVEPRRDFIKAEARKVQNLDV